MAEEYEKYLVEAKSSEDRISKMIERTSGGNVKKIVKKMKIVFTLSKYIDEEETENFEKIDKTVAMLEKMYPGATVRHDWDKFIVEEL
jgi:hypothetical protein